MWLRIQMLGTVWFVEEFLPHCILLTILLLTLLIRIGKSIVNRKCLIYQKLMKHAYQHCMTRTCPQTNEYTSNHSSIRTQVTRSVALLMQARLRYNDFDSLQQIRWENIWHNPISALHITSIYGIGKNASVGNSLHVEINYSPQFSD